MTQPLQLRINYHPALRTMRKGSPAEKAGYPQNLPIPSCIIFYLDQPAPDIAEGFNKIKLGSMGEDMSLTYDAEKTEREKRFAILRSPLAAWSRKQDDVAHVRTDSVDQLTYEPIDVLEPMTPLSTAEAASLLGVEELPDHGFGLDYIVGDRLAAAYLDMAVPEFDKEVKRIEVGRYTPQGRSGMHSRQGLGPNIYLLEELNGFREANGIEGCLRL